MSSDVFFLFYNINLKFYLLLCIFYVLDIIMVVKFDINKIGKIKAKGAYRKKGKRMRRV
jgi:hypothetical protein